MHFRHYYFWSMNKNFSANFWNFTESIANSQLMAIRIVCKLSSRFKASHKMESNNAVFENALLAVLPSFEFPLPFCFGLSTWSPISFHNLTCFGNQIWFVIFVSDFPFFKSHSICEFKHKFKYAYPSIQRTYPVLKIFRFWHKDFHIDNFHKLRTAPQIEHNWHDLVPVKTFKTFPSIRVRWRSYDTLMLLPFAIATTQAIRFLICESK